MYIIAVLCNMPEKNSKTRTGINLEIEFFFFSTVDDGGSDGRDVLMDDYGKF